MDGIFYFQEEDALNLLRFYNDGTVLGVETTATIDQMSLVLTWFNKENTQKTFAEGVFTMEGANHIRFRLMSSHGVVVYEGHVLNTMEIKLDMHSHIDDYRHQAIYQRYLFEN